MRPARRASNSRAKASPSAAVLREFDGLFHRLVVEAIEKFGIDFADGADHFADHFARFGRSVGRRLHAPEAMQDDAGKRVHHGGESGDGQDVARDFDGALFGLTRDFLQRASGATSRRCARCRREFRGLRARAGAKAHGR